MHVRVHVLMPVEDQAYPLSFGRFDHAGSTVYLVPCRFEENAPARHSEAEALTVRILRLNMNVSNFSGSMLATCRSKEYWFRTWSCGGPASPACCTKK